MLRCRAAIDDGLLLINLNLISLWVSIFPIKRDAAIIISQRVGNFLFLFWQLCDPHYGEMKCDAKSHRSKIQIKFEVQCGR